MLKIINHGNAMLDNIEMELSIRTRLRINEFDDLLLQLDLLKEAAHNAISTTFIKHAN